MRFCSRFFLHLSEYYLYLQSRKLSAPAFIECGMEQELRETIIQGLMAERLGKGLQNLVQRFDSASDLTKLTQPFDTQKMRLAEQQSPLNVKLSGLLFYAMLISYK